MNSWTQRNQPLVCTGCGSKLKVGGWFDKKWHCIWCWNNVSRNKDVFSKERYIKKIKVEEICCNNEL